MERTVAALTRHYPHRDQASAQALAVLAGYPGLLNPEQSDFTYDDGRVELLLSLTGVLPVPIGPNTYHCPVAIWLPLDFPAKPPLVFVLPSETLAIRKGKNVDASGKVGVPYLDNWSRKAEGCSLTGLIQDLIPVFAARYPVSVVQPKARPPRPTASPEASQNQSSALQQSQAPQPPPPRPPPPVGSPSPANGLPPRPPLPPGATRSGSRPSSGVLEPGSSSNFGSAGSRSTGSPAPPPRPPPPVTTSGASAQRALPGSFSQPPGPPPAYPAQPPHPPPAQPPVPPPQRASTILSYGSPPPLPPAAPVLPPNEPLPAAPHPQNNFSSPSHPQGGANYAAPPSYHPPPSQPAGSAQPVYGQPPGTHPPLPPPHASPRAGSPAPSTARAYSPVPSSVAPPQPPHPPHQRDPRFAEHERRASIESSRSHQPTPPHPPRARQEQPHHPPRPYSPAPSETASYASYAHPPQPPGDRASRHAQNAPRSSFESQRGGPVPVSPPQALPSQPVHQHLERGVRGQTASPIPAASDAGSAATAPFRSRGPRPPPPPSEYSATGEYGSYMPSSQQTSVRGVPTMTDDDLFSQASGYSSWHEGICRAPVRAAEPAVRPPPARTADAYYQRAPEDSRYVEAGESSPFEPVIESRAAAGPTVPYQPRQPPRQPSLDSQHGRQSSSVASYAPYGTPQPPYLPPSSSAMSSPPPPPPAPPGTAVRPNGHVPPPAPYAAVPSPPAPVISAARTARKARPAKAAPLNILDAADEDLASPSSASPSSAASPTSVSVAGGPAAPPPVPPNPALLALRTRVHSKLVSSLTTLAHATDAELSQLDLIRVDLEKAQPAIEDEMARLEAVRSVCLGVRDRYAEVVDQAEGRLREYEARGEGVEVDEIVCGSTVVYTQLLDLVAEDAALEDTIYALGRGLNSGTANIDLDRFLKRVRVLAKEQFVIRATINKILLGLAIRRERTAQAKEAMGGGANGSASGRGTPVAGGGA